MNRSAQNLLHAALLLFLPSIGFAQPIELQAISDFTNRESGTVPYYLDVVGELNALAINAANPDYRNKFARAEHEFLGPDGIYDITINALGEIDGDGTYRLSINGIVQGVAVNTPVSVDYTVVAHKFEGIALTAPTIIGIESSAVSNNMIPEGDGYAFARGRWRSVLIAEHAPELKDTDNIVDLGISLSTIDALLQQGSTAPFIVSVINNSQTTTATAPRVEFFLPESMLFNSSDVCTASIGVVRCLLPELQPGSIATARFTADVYAAGWFNMSASISSDQADSNRVNNVAFLSLNSTDAVVDTTSTVDQTDSGSNSSGTSVNENDTIGTGKLGFPAAFVILLIGLIRLKPTRH